MTVSPWFSVCVDSFMIASLNVLYNILVMTLESIRCPRCCGSSWVCGRLRRSWHCEAAESGGSK